MRYSTSRELAAYWQALRRGRAIPFARDFDSTVNPEALSASFIARRHQDDFVVMETTQSFGDFFGSRLCGGMISKISDAATCDAWLELVGGAAEGAPTVVGAVCAGAAGETPVELLLLPLLRTQAPAAILVLGAAAIAPQTPPAERRLVRICSHRVLTTSLAAPGFGRRGVSPDCRKVMQDFRQRVGEELNIFPQADEDQAFFKSAPFSAARQGRFYVIDGGQNSGR